MINAVEVEAVISAATSEQYLVHRVRDIGQDLLPSNYLENLAEVADRALIHPLLYDEELDAPKPKPKPKPEPTRRRRRIRGNLRQRVTEEARRPRNLGATSFLEDDETVDVSSLVEVKARSRTEQSKDRRRRRHGKYVNLGDRPKVSSGVKAPVYEDKSKEIVAVYPVDAPYDEQKNKAIKQKKKQIKGSKRATLYAGGASGSSELSASERPVADMVYKRHKLPEDLDKFEKQQNQQSLPSCGYESTALFHALYYTFRSSISFAVYYG
eukprot:TRINITY_DN5437_c0_g1_i1.p2 TRINITY_DN5437_c0_g1~~TRINITY_DN5437_c0_g1_i1.p2  ORF type:complete len:268 (-),score=48.28 TRINITY_DN5437_c0_g1_i1:127-930(-)